MKRASFILFICLLFFPHSAAYAAEIISTDFFLDPFGLFSEKEDPAKAYNFSHFYCKVIPSKRHSSYTYYYIDYKNSIFVEVHSYSRKNAEKDYYYSVYEINSHDEGIIKISRYSVYDKKNIYATYKTGYDHGTAILVPYNDGKASNQIASAFLADESMTYLKKSKFFEDYPTPKEALSSTHK